MFKLTNFLTPLAAVVFLFSGCTGDKQQAGEPVKVIFDTDIGNDIDDVPALQMLINYHKAGKAEIMGIGISKAYPRVVEYIDAYCIYNGLHGIPLGYAYGGKNPHEARDYVGETLDTLINGRRILTPARKLPDGIPEGSDLFRKLLAGAPDNSVVFIAVGPATNLGNLIESGPDEYSPLTGVELVAKKVKLLSIMSGTYNDDVFNNPEFNLLQDLPAGKSVFANWPGEIIASGSEVGVRIHYPHQSILNDLPNGQEHPLCVSYKLYDEMPYDRPTWDLTSVLYVFEPETSCLDISPTGRITIAEDGFSTFTEEAGGPHRVLQIRDDKVPCAVEALVRAVTDVVND